MGGLNGARRRSAWGLLLAGLALVTLSGYMTLKATLAQTLIASSWQLRPGDGPAPNPWPWADTRPVARLAAERLGIHRYIMQDDSGESLAFGPGMVPVSSDDSVAAVIIAGHRDTHFAFLRDLRPGDRLELEHGNGEITRWQIRERAVFDAREGLTLPGEGRTLHLVTCWPFDAIAPGGPLRYQVVATPLPPAGAAI